MQTGARMLKEELTKRHCQAHCQMTGIPVTRLRRSQKLVRNRATGARNGRADDARTGGQRFAKPCGFSDVKPDWFLPRARPAWVKPPRPGRILFDDEKLMIKNWPSAGKALISRLIGAPVGRAMKAGAHEQVRRHLTRWCCSTGRKT